MITATASTPAISVVGLTKRYRGVAVVDGLSFEIPRGVVAGFVGPNGAGKTTTMAMLLGLVRPDAGTGFVLGEPLEQPSRYMSAVGALIEGPALWSALTARQNLRALAALGGHNPARIEELLELVGLADRADDAFRRYSLGMKQRLAIAAALLGDPQLLVLDEPANGLDPVGMAHMRDLIGRIAAEGRTVLVSSHLLDDLEQICNWLLVIDSGALLHAGPAAHFLAGAVPRVVAVPEHPDDLPRLAALTAGDIDADALVISVPDADPRTVALAVNRAAIAAGIVLAELGVRRPDLQTHYLERVQGAVR
jgi:ABC-2 type transport system ATP-binding protein